MIPKRVAVKNFLTFGQTPGGGPVEFVFSNDEPLWVLCGANGTGKSAVFDAITYALYGEHRGGGRNADQLIRHGANGFEVEVDFEFAGADYRVTRTRQRKKRPTQHLQQFIDGEWKGVRPGDAVGATTGDDIKKWVAETLGLGYEAFTNSVLLKQGDADKLFTASRDDRIAVLKGIIGFEQFEALSDRVGTSAKAQADEGKSLLAQRNAIREVTADDIAASAAAVEVAAAASDTARAALTRAVERVAAARQWEKLGREVQELEGKIAAADELINQREQIRERKERFDDLSAAVPVLQSLITLREQIEGLTKAAETATATAQVKTAERDTAKAKADQQRAAAAQHKEDAAGWAAKAKELGEGIKQGQPLLAEAKAVEALTAQLAAYPPDLDSRLATAGATETDAVKVERATGDAATCAKTLLTEAKKQQTRFTGVAVGVECPQCRQTVDAGHADRVRAELAVEVSRLQGELDAANAAAAQATSRRTAATAAREQLQEQIDARDELGTTRAANQETLRRFGVTGTASELEAQLEAKQNQQQEAEGQRKKAAEREKKAGGEANRLDTECNSLNRAIKTAEDDKKRHENELATARGQEQTKREQLSDAWTRELPRLTGNDVALRAAERDRLKADEVTVKFEALRVAENQLAGWSEQRDKKRDEIAALPAEAHIPEAAASECQTRAEQASQEAVTAHSAAEADHRTLTGDKARRDDLTERYRVAAEDHRLLAKLDELLGDKRLQLELVRDAEEEIVAFANETLHHLSDGDLALEPAAADESDKAFDLRVRRGGGEPIGVAFLSGSQRFRVAVAIALAVGRFASGRARPLEAVVIDEGFGSLDPLGLGAMAAELKRLQQVNSLRRVILVSHQPDFTDQFPVGYRLEAGDAGTTAAAFRR